MHKLLHFEGKTIAITGAASGIGAATLDLLNATAADVHAIDLAALPAGPQANYQADLGDPASVAELIDHLPTNIDALINCAGLPNGGRFTATQIMAVNWCGLRMLTEGVLPTMPEGSAVVHVASTAARNWQTHQPELAELLAIESAFDETAFGETAFGETAFDKTMDWVSSHEAVVGDGYALSKEAVCYYTFHRSATALLRGVRMNSVSPGVTNTPIAADFVAGVGADAIERAVALAGRIAEPEEMAPALLFLADELSSSFISGVNLTIDRGIKAARIMGEF